jgi:hypothetical protein
LSVAHGNLHLRRTVLPSPSLHYSPSANTSTLTINPLLLYDMEDTRPAGDFDKTRSAWRHNFYGDAITAFQWVVENAEKNFDMDSDYAKFIPIIQSSGMGKSRLIDQYASPTVGIVFTLRYGMQTGYPPGDIEITNLLRTTQTEHEQPTTTVCELAKSRRNHILTKKALRSI